MEPNDNQDPSLVGGYTEIYQKEALLSINSPDQQQTDFEDYVMIRMFKQSANIKIELTSEVNIFFMFSLFFDEIGFKYFIDEEHINISLQQFPKWFEEVIKGPNYHYRFEISNTKGVLIIREKTNLKYLKIGKLIFEAVPQQQLKENLMYRYNMMKHKKMLLNQVLYKSNHIIKTKNPSLLLNFQKSRKPQTFK